MKIGEAAEAPQDGSRSSRPGGPPLRVQCAIRSTVMTIAKTMTAPIPAAVANATGVRAETVVLNRSTPLVTQHTARAESAIGGEEPPFPPSRAVICTAWYLTCDIRRSARRSCDGDDLLSCAL